jgi:hypothetical protein
MVERLIGRRASLVLMMDASQTLKAASESTITGDSILIGAVQNDVVVYVAG